MPRTYLRRWLRRVIFPIGLGVAVVLVLLAGAKAPRAQNSPAQSGEGAAPAPVVNGQPPPAAPKARDDAKQARLEKTRSDAEELSILADQLRDELKKMNINVLSLDVLHKTERLERLAKKIKEDANGR